MNVMYQTTFAGIFIRRSKRKKRGPEREGTRRCQERADGWMDGRRLARAGLWIGKGKRGRADTGNILGAEGEGAKLEGGRDDESALHGPYGNVHEVLELICNDIRGGQYCDLCDCIFKGQVMYDIGGHTSPPPLRRNSHTHTRTRLPAALLDTYQSPTT